MKTCYQCGHDLPDTAHAYVRRDSGLVEPAWSLSRGGVLVPAGLQELLEWERQNPDFFTSHEPHSPKPEDHGLYRHDVFLTTYMGPAPSTTYAATMAGSPLTMEGLQRSIDSFRSMTGMPWTPEDVVAPPWSLGPKRGQVIPFRRKT